MGELFLTVLKMSLTASYVISIIICARLLFKKAPKAISYALWAVTAFRLLIPFSLESIFSLLPRNTNVIAPHNDFNYQQSYQINSGINVIDTFVNKSLPVPDMAGSENSMQQLYLKIGEAIWISGIIAMLVYSLISIVILKRQLKSSQLIEKNIFESRNLKTPFVLGLIKPKIYLPIGLDSDERNYILLHEQTHIYRKDHIIKVFAFLTLSLHWFNPLVWIAFMLMSRDMELSCDERVLKLLKDKDIKKSYANSLLSLATEKHILNGSPLAFGEGNVSNRIKNVLKYKKPRFWVLIVSIIAVIIIGIALATNPKQRDTLQQKATAVEDSLSNIKVTYDTKYNRARIKFVSEMMGFKSANEFDTTEATIVGYIDAIVSAVQTPAEQSDFNNNYTNQYSIELSGNQGGFSCKLYFDTLYNKAYIIKDGDLYETDVDFARYIDSFLENRNIDVNIEDADSVALFKKYGWSFDYQISSLNNKINNINVLTGFNPNAYYFAYNNELSKDIGLDMSGFSNNADIEVKIYRLHESMPQQFYPIQNSRGIVVKKDNKIIGAFISAGRHSTFNACSLKGKNFEEVTGKTISQWLSKRIKADNTEERLSKLAPQQVIEEYFMALNNKNENLAKCLLSKKMLLEHLTTNMSNTELFNEWAGIPLTAAEIGAKSSFDNLKSAKLLKTDLLNERDKNNKIFRVTMDLQYRKELTISSGEQFWDCSMVYESPQTGWKIEGFGH